ncbi:hypothetical protein PV10_08507 [Exophiala mesophila]|uniref:UDP-glucose 6-dehydrogenase n=1 Tax=Exophiala mesophila TaxID=212818 RepID=A0A0D1Z4M2_EXOME|nr:uncharacterized protein PV10_08507 [Exophiala mesophila]KIV88874.1 hypothetical protein PV10_08507 [Exophiala mesophila]
MQPPIKNKRPLTNICCVGAGYVGGPSAAVIASKAPHLKVTVVDVDARRIEAWNSDNLPVYEPGLWDLVKPARDGTPDRPANLFFSTNIEQKVREADIVFIGVNTPTKKTGLGAGKASDLGWLEAATRRVAQAAEKDTIIVEKSTVPCGTANSMREILMANAQPGVHFEVLSNPEFLAEGTAIKNLLNPDRILVGCLETQSGYIASAGLVDIYANWVPRERIITMNLWSSELSKLAANAMLAQRISSINALSSICEAVSANVQDVAYAVGLDSRIGPKMMNASVGFGGSCFKKDILNLVYISESLNLPEVAAYWQAVVSVNEYQKNRFVRGIVKSMHNNLVGKKLAILGFAYKKDTGDTRESAAIDVVNSLLAENATIHIFDPQVRPEQIMSDLHLTMDDDRVTICDDPYIACQDAHGVVILTEWDMFTTKKPIIRAGAAKKAEAIVQVAEIIDTPTEEKEIILDAPAVADVTVDTATTTTTTLITPPVSPPRDARDAEPKTPKHEKIDWSRVASLMDRPKYVFDGRNTIDVAQLESLGFKVSSIGVSSRTL